MTARRRRSSSVNRIRRLCSCALSTRSSSRRNSHRAARGRASPNRACGSPILDCLSGWLIFGVAGTQDRASDGAGCAPPIGRLDLPRTPGDCARESRAPSATGRVDAHGQAPAAPHEGSTFWVLIAPRGGGTGGLLDHHAARHVVRWHRQWLRCQWTWRSIRRRPGRPSTDTMVRTLVDEMATANPLWGAPRICSFITATLLSRPVRVVHRVLPLASSSVLSSAAQVTIWLT